MCKITTNKIDYYKVKEKMYYRDIARIANVTPEYIHQLAKNKRKNPSIKVMQGIAKALNKKISEIFPELNI